METTERIVESYVRYIKGWATIPNVKCKGQLEIDLIAIDPVSGRRYHIESGISVSGGFSKLTGRPFDPESLKQRTQQASQRRTIGYFRDRKFGSPSVLERLQEYGFAEDQYERVIVTWGWTDEARQQAEEADIRLWDFRRIMLDIAESASSREYFADDTLRTLQLLVKSFKENPEGA